MVGFCEDTLKDRLRSPSEYRRVDVSDLTKQMPPAEWESLQNKYDPSSRDYHARTAEFARSAGELFTHYRFILEYDAPNAFGTPIRGRALCEYLSGGDSPPASASFVRINGMTHTEWLISQLKN